MERIEIDIRKMLDHIVREGGYSAGSVVYFRELYEKGRRENQQEIKAVLGINDCECD